MDKNILRLAIPNIISNITVPLLGMIDMFIVGHLNSEFYIGAIAIAVMLFNMMYWGFSFLRMGTSGFTAQAFGANNQTEIVNILLRSLFVAITGGLLIILLQYFILKVAFHFIQGSEQTLGLAADYFYIYVWAAPAVLAMYTMSGWFIGMQDSKTPMYVSIVVNIINIVLSILLVFVFRWELKGVALASTVAQYIGVLMYLLIWQSKYKDLKSKLNTRFLKKISDLLPFFQVNSNIFLRNLCLIIVSTFFTAASAKQGNTILAVNSLMMQLFILFSYMMDGFAYAAEALTGRYVGAKDTSALKTLIKRLFIWGFSLTAIFTLVYLLFSKNIIGIFTDKENIIEASNSYIGWILLIPIAGFSAFLWDGIFVGMTASKQMRNSMFIAMICFFTLYYALNPTFGNNGLWIAFIFYLAVRGIVQTFMFKDFSNKVLK